MLSAERLTAVLFADVADAFLLLALFVEAEVFLAVEWVVLFGAVERWLSGGVFFFSSFEVAALPCRSIALLRAGDTTATHNTPPKSDTTRIFFQPFKTFLSRSGLISTLSCRFGLLTWTPVCRNQIRYIGGCTSNFSGRPIWLSAAGDLVWRVLVRPRICAESTQPVLRTFLLMPAIQSPGTEEVHPDVALVARAKDGDEAAFEQLVRQYERQIYRVAQHITQNREDAEDITQDTFLKAYEKLEQFQGNSKFSTWLVRIAVNESLMRLRKRKTSKTVSMDEDVQTEEGSIPRDFAEWRPNPEQIYDQNELGDILRKTIQGLPPGFRTVFTLRDIENLSTEETAEALGLSVPAVKSRLLRARLQLRERLSRYFRQKKEGLTA